MARSPPLLVTVPLYLILILSFSVISSRASHHFPIANLLHRRQSPTSVAARLAVLMPRGPGNASWTTAVKRAEGNTHIVPLNDEALRPTKAMQNPRWSYGNAPDGKRSLIAKYPKESYTFTHEPKGGFSFYAKGPIDLDDAKEVTFGYSVFFPKDFEFNRGGKLPGLCKLKCSVSTLAFISLSGRWR